MQRVALSALYLAAIVAANLSSSHFGPEASIYNAFAFIGLTLTTRDRLHDLWGENRARNMVLLIAAGSGLSFAAAHAFAGSAPPDVVAQVALGSLCAFAAAESVDAFVYHAMRRLPWLERANGSNLVSAAVDSIVFPTVAFGGLMWSITFGQFAAKVAGGVLFSMLLTYARGARTFDLSTDAGALAAVEAGVLKPHEAPLAVIRAMQRKAGR